MCLIQDKLAGGSSITDTNRGQGHGDIYSVLSYETFGSRKEHHIILLSFGAFLGVDTTDGIYKQMDDNRRKRPLPLLESRETEFGGMQ